MSNVAYLPGNEPESVPAETPRGPQVEDGYTRVANDLLEQIMEASFTLREMRVVMAVMRLTYGWNRKQARVTAGLLSKLTGMPEAIASKTLSGLITKQVILRHGGSRSPVSLNKHADKWDLDAEKYTPPPPKSKRSDSEQNALSQIEQNALPSKDRKDTPNPKGLGNVQSHRAAFEIFYNAGLPKKNRKKAESVFAKHARKQQDPMAFAQMLADNIASRICTGELGFDAMHPTTYLNQQRWEDELPERCPHADILAAWNNELPAHIEKVSADDWTPAHKGFQALAAAWENFKTKPRASTGKPVFTDEQGGIEFYREVFRRLASVDRVQLEESARWCRLSWAVQQAETIRIFKGEVS